MELLPNMTAIEMELTLQALAHELERINGKITDAPEDFKSFFEEQKTIWNKAYHQLLNGLPLALDSSRDVGILGEAVKHYRDYVLVLDFKAYQYKALGRVQVYLAAYEKLKAAEEAAQNYLYAVENDTDGYTFFIDDGS